MQNYMISSRKKNGVSATETVEDRAAKDFRNMVRTRGERQRQKKTGNLMYAASAALVLIVIVMGVTMISSFDRMKSVQSTLNSLTGKTDTVETQETSGQVTAVTSDNEAEPDETDAAGYRRMMRIHRRQKIHRTTVQMQMHRMRTSPVRMPRIRRHLTEGQVSSENGSDGVYIVEKGDTLRL